MVKEAVSLLRMVIAAIVFFIALLALPLAMLWDVDRDTAPSKSTTTESN